MTLQYVPSLKAKKGELEALSQLSQAQIDQIMPLLEIPEISWDFVNEKQSKKVDDHISDVTKAIEKYWKGKPFFLDFQPNIQASLADDGKFAYDLVTVLPEATSLNFTPVIGFERSSEYIKQAVSLGKKRKAGVCLRAQYDDFDDVHDKTAYNEFIKKFEIDLEATDLIIDLSTVCRERSKTMYLALRLIMAEIPEIKRWRRLIVIASSFPENLRGVKRNTTEEMPRVEWGAWKIMLEKKTKIPRMPIFGDYGIANPIFTEIDPRIMDMSAAIRYSSGSAWIIFKGESVRMNGFKQFKKLSAALINSKYYSGQEFSIGDQEIYKYATATTPETGNAMIWRRIGNNHHFVLVLTQLAELSK